MLPAVMQLRLAEIGTHIRPAVAGLEGLADGGDCAPPFLPNNAETLRLTIESPNPMRAGSRHLCSASPLLLTVLTDPLKRA